MAKINYFKMYRELYTRELNKDPLRNVIMNALFVAVGLGVNYSMRADIAAKGCLQVKGGACITAASDPFQYYLYTNWFLVFAILGVFGLITSIKILLKKRAGDKSRNA